MKHHDITIMLKWFLFKAIRRSWLFRLCDLKYLKGMRSWIITFDKIIISFKRHQDQLLQIVEFSTKTKVLVRQTFRGFLNRFASVRNLMIDSLILIVETREILSKLLGHIWSFTENFSSKSFDLLNLFWALALLFDGEVVAKFVLILLP